LELDMTETPIPHNSIVVVGDGRKALFLRNDGSPLHPKLSVVRLLEHEAPPTRELGSDRPGRLGNPAGSGGRSAIEQTDWHQLEESRFAQTVTQTLARAASANPALQIVLVAPPKTLGELRSLAHKSLQTHIVGEITRDLTSHPIAHIEEILAVERL